MHQIAREADDDELHSYAINVEGFYLEMVEATGSSGDDDEAEMAWVAKNRRRLRSAYSAYLSADPA